MPAYPNQNESWKIKSIESRRKIIILGNDNSESKFYSVSSIPTSWVVGDEVYEPELYDEKHSKLFTLKNKTKDGRPDGYLIDASGDILKSLGSHTPKSTPVLGVPLEIRDIYGDTIMEPEDGPPYRYVPELDLEHSFPAWRVGHHVIVSKVVTGYKVENLETKKSIIMSRIMDEDEE